jgi:hypothetical protein
MANQPISEATPVHHTAKVRQKLTELVDHLRSVGKVSDPRAQALFETTDEVLLGLRTAHEHFEQLTEIALKRAN